MSKSSSWTYDVFLSHNSVDKPEVEIIARRLCAAAIGLRPFLDEWHLVPGTPWVRALEDALQNSATVAVFFGKTGSGSWRHEEMRLALDRAVQTRDEFRVIPVLLPGADPETIGGFLRQRTWVDFRGGLDDEDALKRLVAGIRGEAVEAGSFALPDEPAPYRGLERFEAEHAVFFFGRDRDTRTLIERLERDNFVAVVGASGSGKSSLVRAGLLHRLAEDAIPGSRAWRMLTVLPGSDPLRALANELARAIPQAQRMAAVKQLLLDLDDADHSWLETLTTWYANDPKPLLLVIDQFEEILTGNDGALRDHQRRARLERFIANLVDVTKPRENAIRVVITCRADSLDRLLAIPGFPTLLQDQQLLLGELGAEALREIVIGPAQRVGAFFEKGLVHLILREGLDQPGALPLLQQALHELWRARRGPWLTLDAYEQSGGVAGALQRRAQQTYDSLKPESRREIARDIFLRLTTLGEGVADTRRRTLREELYGAATDRAEVDAVLNHLSGKAARLIRADEDTVEITHDALMQHWDTLKAWLSENRDALRVHRQLTEAAGEWEKKGKRDADLYQSGSARLAEAEEWQKAHAGRMNLVEQEFLATSLALRQREADERRRRLHESERALARQLSLHAEIASRDGPRRGLLLAVESLKLSVRSGQPRAAEAERVLHDGLANCSGTGLRGQVSVGAVAFSPDGRWLATSESGATSVRLWNLQADDPAAASLVLDAHYSAVRDLAFGTNSRWLVTSSDDHTLRLWNVSAREPAASSVVIGHQEASEIVISPNNRWLVIDKPGAVRLLDLTADAPVTTARSFETGGEQSQARAVSPDGRWLAIRCADASIQLRDLLAGKPDSASLVLRKHQWPVRVLAFSPTNEWLVTGSADYTARLWKLAAGNPAKSSVLLLGHEDEVTSVLFSPDGRWLATGGADGATRLWDLAARRLSSASWVVADHLRALSSRWLVTGKEADLRLWDLSRQAPAESPHLLRGHEGQPGGPAAISPDDRWLVESGHIWNLAPVRPSAHPVVLTGYTSYGNHLALDANNCWLVTGGQYELDPGVQTRQNLQRAATTVVAPVKEKHGVRDALAHRGRALLWLLVTLAIRRRYGGAGLRATPLAPVPGRFTAPAARIVTPGAAVLWDLAARDPVPRRVFDGHAALVCATAVSPDGHWLATGSQDATARLWNLTTTDPAQEPTVLRGHQRPVRVVALSNQWLLTGCHSSGDVRLWNLRAKDLAAAPIILGAPRNTYYFAAFSPDGRWVALVSHSRCQIWNTAAPDSPPVLLPREIDGSGGLSISANSRWLATAGRDNAVLLWDLNALGLAEEPMVFRGLENAVSSVALDPEGRWLIAGDHKGGVLLWDLNAPDPPVDPFVLSGHERPVIAAAFSPNGRWVATGDGASQFSYSGSENAYVIGDFSLATDAEVRVWDLASGQPGAEPVVFRGHHQSITALAFSPDSRWLLTASRDNTVRLWLPKQEDLVNIARRTVGRNLTFEEWTRYFPGRSYETTFPELPADVQAIADRLHQARRHAVAGDRDAARLDYEGAIRWAIGSDHSGLCSWACFWGCVDGFPSLALEAGHRAVTLAPANGWYRDRRGLARALSGDRRGAIEDFEFYVEWARGAEAYEKYGRKREQWLAELSAGRNPFDSALIQQLQEE